MKTSQVFLFIILIFLITSTFQIGIAGDNLVDTFNNGTTTGFFRFWYQTSDHNLHDRQIFYKENSIFDAGLMLGYTTDSFYGFGAGFKFYAVDDLSMNGIIACKCIHNVNSGQAATYLGEAFLTYKRSGLTAIIGRQNISSPLINSDAWAVVPNNFEALMLYDTDVPNTKLTAGYIRQERWLKSTRFEDISSDGIYMFGVNNTSIPSSTMSAWYYHVNRKVDGKLFSAIYADAGTKISILGLKAQYMLLNSDDPDKKDTNAYGAKLYWQEEIFEISAAYTSVSDGSFNAAKISDHGIKTPLYTATLSGDGDIAGAVDTDSYKFSGTLKLFANLKLITNFGYFDHGEHFSPSPNSNSTSIEFVGKFTAFKFISFFVGYIMSEHNSVGAWKGSESDVWLNSLRVWSHINF
jgi:hypothetical protein